MSVEDIVLSACSKHPLPFFDLKMQQKVNMWVNKKLKAMLNALTLFDLKQINVQWEF
jgi:hypothetical protein